MPPKGPDASNSCLPPSSPVIISTPPIPHTERGERCSLDGTTGRLHGDNKPLLSYCSGKLIVARTLDASPLLPSISPLPVRCYRGHHYNATALKLSPSGAYMASGDERGMLRIWAFDHEDHLCKYENPGLTSVIRDLAWDGESKKVVLGGERLDARSECARVLQYDTGVTVGSLAMHFKGRVASVAYKPTRPFRIVTAGKDDTKTYFHQGPPFAKIPPLEGIPQDSGHTKGAVTCVRYNHAGTLVVSVSTDRAICIYDGKTLELKHKLEHVHAATIYCVDWSGDDQYVMTASGDGTCKLFAVDVNGTLSEQHTWKPAEHQNKGPYDKVPVGGNQVACAFSGGTRPVSVGLNGQISLLPPVGSKDDSIQVITGHSAAVAALAVDVNNQVFYTGDSDGVLCQWDLKTCTVNGRLLPPEGNADLMYVVHTGAISGLAVMQGDLLSVGWDDKLFVTPSGTLQVNMEPEIIGAQPSAVAVGTAKGAVATVAGLALCGVKGALQSIMAIDYEATAICVSKDDKTLYVGGSDCKIHIYDITGDQPVERHVIENGHLKPLTALALSNDGTKLAAGDQRDVCVWDLATYTALVAKGRWCFHVQRVTCLSWSPDDQVIASGGADDSIYLWSIEKKMKRVHYPFAHRGGLTGLAFVNDGYKFVSVGADSVVNMWDVAKDVQEKFA